MTWTVAYAKQGDRYETELSTFEAAVGFVVDGYEDGTYAGLRITGPDGQSIEGEALNEAKLRFMMPERYGPLSEMEAERMTDKPIQMPDLSDLERAFAQAGREVGKMLGVFGFVMRAQGAMGFMVQGNTDRAREALDGFTPEQRAKVAEAARKLAELADE